jgi:serralysin
MFDMKRRFAALAGVGLSALLLAGCMTPDESHALQVINHDRAVNGVYGLGENFALNDKAQRWADWLAQRSGGTCSMATLSHSNLADGAPAGWRMLGENVGCRVAPGTVADAVGPLQTSFMNSPGHRANILNGNFNTGGIGFSWVPAANGMPNWYAIYEVQEFATL